MIDLKGNIKSKLVNDKRGFAQLVPMVLVVVIVFAMLFVGAFVIGDIHQSLAESFPDAAGTRTPAQNSTLFTINNTSGNWDSTLDIVQVGFIITVLAAAIGAIFLFTRCR